MSGFRAATRGFFSTMRIPIARGRGFTTDDREGAPRVVVVNEAFVKQFFPTSNPLGQRIALGTEYDGSLPWMEIVGVIGNTLQAPDAEARSEMPYEQFPDPFFTRMYQNITLVVRSTSAPALVEPALRQVVKAIDRNQPVVNLRTMDDVIERALAQPRFRTVLLGLFAAVALLLAGVGIFGLLAHGVAQRSTEFGVRLALGASPQHVVRMVVREGLVLALAGLAVGIAGAFFAVQLITSVLFAVTTRDPVAWASAIVCVAVAALIASWLPARRAVRIDPAQSLRV
jgi:putative ABC transport system permease protein